MRHLCLLLQNFLLIYPLKTENKLRHSLNLYFKVPLLEEVKNILSGFFFYERELKAYGLMINDLET